MATAIGVALATACAQSAGTTSGTPAATAATPPSPPAAATAGPARGHLADVRQLTFGGENAEAYWSFDGKQLVMQARGPGDGCDRIFRLDLAQPRPTPIPVSSGQGATTCSFFLPGDREVIYSSTHLGGEACPPKPDHSKGYVWPLYTTYDVFRGGADGSNPRPLTSTTGYDAESTVCRKDGSIVFTSVRDGDLELYRMDPDGKNVRRLTNTVGYDGGAFFSPDCSKLVWRASRPRPGAETDEYKRLLAENLVRPSKLEIWVGDADGGDARQITYLGAASFAPAFFPSGRRIIFSSNAGDPRGREFDLWAVDIDGSNLERITTEPGFDGFPMFSPDGTQLAFASNRATPPGSHDTNVFVARWLDRAEPIAPRAPAAADRIAADIAWLADRARGGRGIGTAGLDASGAWVEARMQALGLQPAGEGGGYRQPFPVAVGLNVDEARVTLDGTALAPDQLRPARFSASGEVRGAVAFADYGVIDDKHGVDHWKGVKADGRVVVVRRFVPEGAPFDSPDAEKTHGDLRRKAWLARERGAKALLVVDAPRAAKPAAGSASSSAGATTQAAAPPPEAPFPTLIADGQGDAGLPVVFVKRAAIAPLLAKLESGGKVEVALAIRLRRTTAPAFNVVGRLASTAPAGKRLPGVVVVGAHYDHLGGGGRHSLTPDRDEPHLGADDNASGTATVLEIARTLSARRAELARDVVFVAFSGEEEGVLGSTWLTRNPPAGLKMSDVVAMVNLDMVGRMRDNRLDALGAKSAAEWPELLEAACAAARVQCTPGGGDGLGPSDQMPFYTAGVPVVHLFTGVHADYHKPSDAPAAINAAGAAAVGQVAAQLVTAVAARADKLSYQKLAVPPRESDMRSFNASLGTIPDYTGPPGGAKGVLLSGVRPGGAGDKAGLRRGDILLRLGRHAVDNVQDFSYVLNASKPGETVTAIVLRDGKELRVPITFQEGRRK
jgi:Tol biopolymer transport system component